MAELYLEQGHAQQALEIYERLVGRNPEDKRLVRRLAELRASVGGTPAGDYDRGGAMSFRENLQRVVDSVPGALSATIMGFDGIAIDSFIHPSSTATDMQTLLVEYSSATQQLRRAAESTPDLGALVELSVIREGNTCLLRPLTEEYFMAVVVAPHGLVGKARYMLRIIAPIMMQDLSS